MDRRAVAQTPLGRTGQPRGIAKFAFFLAAYDSAWLTGEVIRASGLPASAVSVGLLSLEMKRMVRQLPGKVFVRVR